MEGEKESVLRSIVEEQRRRSVNMEKKGARRSYLERC